MINKHILRQLETIPELTEKNVQIIACAGSGKTEFIAHRIAYMIAAGKAAPEKTVAFTFTERAGRELKERIQEKAAILTGTTQAAAAVFAGTIHGWCFEFLKTCLPEFSLYDILDEAARLALLGSVSRKIGLHDLERLLTRRGMVSAFPTSKRGRLYSEFARSIDIIREEGLDPRQVSRMVPFEKAFRDYKKVLKERHLLDFSGILRQTADILSKTRNPAVFSDRLPAHLTVDEYQDINTVQEEIIRALNAFGAGLCAVGDDDQSIYQWRGADVRNILNFRQRYRDVYTHTLPVNYRSTDQIVSLAQSCIEHNRGARLPKEMRASSAQGEEGDRYAVIFNEQAKETEFIAGKIRELAGVAWQDPDGGARPLSFRDIGMLFRSVHGQARPYLRALQRAGIPYVLRERDSFWELPVIKAVFMLFSFLGEFAGEAVNKEWRVPDEAAVFETAHTAFPDLKEPEFTKGLIELKTGINGVYGISLQHILSRAMELFSVNRLDPSDKARAIWDDLACFSRIIAAFELPRFYPTDRALNEFCWYIVNHRGQILKGLRDERDDRGADAVQIMTLHAAKGLSFPAVFMPCCVERQVPDEEWNFLKADSFDSARYSEDTKDERRLFYVGMTRSRKFLFITSCEQDEQSIRVPSRFLNELDDAHCIRTDSPDPTERPCLAGGTRPGKPETAGLEWPAVAEYMECGLKYYFRYELGFRSPVAGPMGYVRGLEHILGGLGEKVMQKGKVPGSEAVRQAVEQKMFLRYASRKQKAMLQQTAEQRIARYLEVLHKQKVPLQSDANHFCLPLENGMLTGRYEEAVDAETGGRFIPLVTFGNETDTPKDRDLEGGLFALASGTGDAPAESIHAITVTRRTCRVKRKKIKPRDLRRVKTMVEKAVQGIRAEQFTAGPCKRRICRTCDWRHFCPNG
ncbi:UvrD-helicase domain-containing protein [Planctomycetota bacterium]